MKTTTIKPSAREALILRILAKMLKLHKKYYATKREKWAITKEQLLAYPMGSLGYKLGEFWQKNHFEPIPMIERHDVFHLLFGFNTSIKDEIAMLFFQIGNGKITPFTSVSAFGAALFYPESIFYFIKHFNRGRNAISVANWDFRPFLNENFHELKEAIFLRRVPYSSVLQKIKTELTKNNYHGTHQTN